MLPNDEPACINGLALPDHGELWSAVFEVLEQAPHSVRMHARCATAGIDVEKAIGIEHNAIFVRYTLVNLRDTEWPFMWKLHPALAIAPGDRIYIPARRYALEPASPGTLEGGPISGDWPVVRTPNRSVDLRCALPPEAGELFFACALDLAESACGVYRPSERSLCLWTFPENLFRACMMFACYGGWRGHYVTVLEPTTAWHGRGLPPLSFLRDARLAR